MNKIVIKYESETLLPKELEDAINKMRKNIYESKHEEDKIYLSIERLRHQIINWLHTNKEANP